MVGPFAAAVGRRAGICCRLRAMVVWNRVRVRSCFSFRRLEDGEREPVGSQTPPRPDANGEAFLLLGPGNAGEGGV